MAETDKILEAEQSIQNLASELNRMRNAANLLQGAQTQAETVIESAERLVKETGRFSSSCGTIIDKLSSSDLSQKLDGLQTLHAELDSVKTALVSDMNAQIEQVQLGIQGTSKATLKSLDEQSGNIRKEIARLSTDIRKEIARLSTELEEFRSKQVSFERKNKILQSIIIMFVIISTIISLVVLAKI